MPQTFRPARLVVAACLVVVTWLSVAPTPAAALEPPRPLPRYRVDFVTQTDERPWNDCLWASGAMLLDKWTNGEVKRTHQQLRRMSGDLKGGSLFPELSRAYARLGIRLRFSPNGGERITWATLLRRLAKGAGAVILGDYSELPRRYGRWDYRFWRGKARNGDNHAMYIERYDRRHDRVWLMDPLARGDGWRGEWIPVSALRKFAWTSGGALHVALTPTARPAPFAGVSVGEPELSLTATTLEAAWGLQAPRKWRFPGTNTRVAIEPAEDPVAVAAGSLPVAPPRLVGLAAAGGTVVPVAPEPPADPVTAADRHALRVTAALPARPGAYRASITLTDRRFGRLVAGARDVAVYVPGERRASLRLRGDDDLLDAGSSLEIKVSVDNTGEVSWTGAHTPGVLAEEAVERVTIAVAHWVPIDVPPASRGSRPVTAPAPIELGVVPLEPGGWMNIRATLLVPAEPGAWGLVIDLEDNLEGSFAALGSAPASRVYEVAALAGKTETP